MRHSLYVNAKPAVIRQSYDASIRAIEHNTGYKKQRTDPPIRAIKPTIENRYNSCSNRVKIILKCVLK